MKHGTRFWMATVDPRCARLLRGAQGADGRLRLAVAAVLDATGADHPPTPPPVGATLTPARPRRPRGEGRERRFAAEAAGWLEEEALRRGLETVHLFCSPPLLGWMRAGRSPSRRLPAHAVDLASLGPDQLAAHPAVQRLAAAGSRAVEAAKAAERRACRRAARDMTADLRAADQLAREHAGVRAGIRGLQAEIDRLQGRGAPPGLGRLLRELRELDLHLRRHFALEEREGFLANHAGLELEPRKQEEIAELLTQHRGMERDLVGLVDGVERAAAAEAGLPDPLAARLREFLGELTIHEARENRLVDQLMTAAGVQRP